MSKQTVYNILASAKKEPIKVELSLVKEADALYDQLVKGARSQVPVLLNVEKELQSLVSVARKLQDLDLRIQELQKELGTNMEFNYAADAWVSDLETYADRVGSVASVL